MSELKPCPICGGEPDRQHFNASNNCVGRIICSCGIEIQAGRGETMDDITIIWNTRAGEGTRWHELFGTPERAAQTIIGKQLAYDLLDQCDECPNQTDECFEPSGKCAMDDYGSLLEWLRGDAE